MSISLFHEILLTLLHRCADGREWTIAAPRGLIADDFALADAERQELLPSGTQTRFVDRLCWAESYLERAGLIGRIGREAFTIFNAGGSVIAGNLGSPKP